jgi:hypothetical protein
VKVFLLLIAISNYIYAYDLCDYIELKTCDANTKAMGRNNSASFPNSSSAAINNPSSLSMEKGFGIESIFYNGNSKVGLITGSGRIGAAISQSPTQESFFSNMAFETSNVYRQRRVENMLHKPEDSYSFSLAANIFGKKKRKGLQFDLGLIAKRNGQADQNFLGAGGTLSYNKVISFGYAQYKDIFYEDLRNQTINLYDTNGNDLGETTYPDNPLYLTDINLLVETFIWSLKYGNFAFDHLTIKTTYEDDIIDPTYIKIFNTSVFYKKWIFTYGMREEESYREAYSDEVFKSEKFKHDGFLGIQYAIGKSALIGFFSNYYLLNEVSLGLVIFI